ncbi:hypothetical protein [Nocardioides faecalis]|nr:hypothetical protein [Nocardioides faecalis]
MHWHTSTIEQDRLQHLIQRIRAEGGTVGSCQRCSEGLLVTWFVP